MVLLFCSQRYTHAQAKAQQALAQEIALCEGRRDVQHTVRIGLADQQSKAPGAERQAGRDDGRQALGNGGHRQGNGNLEVIRALRQREVHGAPVRQARGRIGLPEEEVPVVDDPDQDADPEDDLQRCDAKSDLGKRIVSGNDTPDGA